MDLVKRVTSEILMQRLRINGTRHPDHTRTMIRQKMASEDNDIALDTLKVSIQVRSDLRPIEINSVGWGCPEWNASLNGTHWHSV